MSVDTDSLVPFILMWGIPTFMVVRAYLKMNPDDQRSAINDFKSRHFILTIGFLVIGAFIAHVGILFSLRFIEIMGIIFFILGGIISAFDIWNRSKIRSVFTLVIVLVVIFVNVI
ncbi:MAG: hypothetical protein WAM95_02950 [Bacillus sp. (in: firmicutes)]